MKILYEDNHTIAVVKPAGVPVQGDSSGDPALTDHVKAYIKEAYDKPGDVFLGLVHRLDRPVGGVMVFARTSKGATRLSEQFRSRQAKKTYWAVVQGCPPDPSGEVNQWVLKDRSIKRSRAVEPNTSGAKPARLKYRVIKADSERALVEIQPETGRPHQIRLAMETLGCPILGDLKYGAEKGLGHQIALWAVSLEFRRPVGGEPIRIEDYPEWDFIPGGQD